MTKENSKNSSNESDLSEFDQAVRQSLADLPDPSGLRESILEQCQNAPEKRQKVIIQWAKPLAAVAAAVIMIGMLFVGYIQYYNSRVSTFAEFREGMAYYAAGAYFQLDFLSNELEPIQDWLANEQSPRFDELPDMLQAKTPVGCKTLHWRDQAVTLVCFHRDDGKIVHLFIIDKHNQAPEAFAEIEQVAISHGLQTGGWETDDKIYLLSGSEPGVTVEEYLPFNLAG